MREYIGKSRADARVRMAEYAMEHEMYGQAMEGYAAALALDPENREAIAAARKEAREKAAKAPETSLTPRTSCSRRWTPSGAPSRPS